MATNPIDPNSAFDRDRNRQRDARPAPHEHDPEIKLQPESRFPWPLVAILVAGLLLAAIIAYMPRSPKPATPPPAAATIPDQPFLDELQLTQLNVSTSPVGGQIYVLGQLQNTGNHEITGITVDAVFHDQAGAVIQRQTRPLSAMAATDASSVSSFADNPLKPNTQRNFRAAFDNIPASWNHQLPELRIVHEAYVGGPSPLPTGNDAQEGNPAPSAPRPNATVNGASPQPQNSTPPPK